MKLMKFKHRINGADVFVRPASVNALIVGGNTTYKDPPDGKERLAVSIGVEGCGIFPLDDTIESVRSQFSKNSISIDDPTPLSA